MIYLLSVLMSLLLPYLSFKCVPSKLLIISIKPPLAKTFLMCRPVQGLDNMVVLCLDEFQPINQFLVDKINSAYILFLILEAISLTVCYNREEKSQFSFHDHFKKV